MTIEANAKIAPGYFRIVFKTKSLARFSIPGQFCLLSVPGVFLRRPLSISSAAKDRIEFLYKVVGPGTKTLSELKKGEQVKILGPLGTPYDLDNAKTPLLIAGGTGIASLSFLAQKLKKTGVIFYGARRKSEFIPLRNFEKHGWKIIYSTDDGSKGYKGFITGCLEKFLKDKKDKKVVIYACGPKPMLGKVREVCKSFGIEGYISLEEMMACGVGNCQGCAVRSGETYKMVCKDGPVFSVNDVEI